jgi:hypothetical protein
VKVRAGVLSVLAGITAIGSQASAMVTAGPLTGTWGGEHVGLELDAEGGKLRYDCAAGTINRPVLPDASGRFQANGAHRPNMGGPARQAGEPPLLPASYTGTIRGDIMTLSVRVPSRAMEIGPFTLRRGAEPILLRCL